MLYYNIYMGDGGLFEGLFEGLLDLMANKFNLPREELDNVNIPDDPPEANRLTKREKLIEGWIRQFEIHVAANYKPVDMKDDW